MLPELMNTVGVWARCVDKEERLKVNPYTPNFKMYVVGIDSMIIFRLSEL